MRLSIGKLRSIAGKAANVNYPKKVPDSLFHPESLNFLFRPDNSTVCALHLFKEKGELEFPFIIK